MGQTLKHRHLRPQTLLLLTLGWLSAGAAWAQSAPPIGTDTPAGHWLDLAEQARQHGQNDAALEFLDTLQERHAPLPAGIAQYVENLRAELRRSPANATAPTARETHTTVSLGLAHDSNINAGLAHDSLTLNLPQATVQLPVAPASLAHSATTARVQMLHQRALDWAGTPWTWLIHAQARALSPETAAQQQDLLMQLQTPLRAGPYSGHIGLGYSQHRRQHQTQVQVPHLHWRSAPMGQAQDCRHQTQLQTEWRQHPQAPHLDSQWTGWRQMAHCSHGLWRYDAHLQAAYESAQRDERPGGDTRHLGWGLTLSRQAPLGQNGHTLRLGLAQLYSSDTRGYHPYMSQNASRHQTRTDLQIAWSAPLSASNPWRWNLQLQNTRQNSNLELFRIHNRAMEISLSRAW